LRMFTRGRLVPRQPWAIKRTTRTELRDENIYIAKFIHWNNGAIPTQLRDETIVATMLLLIRHKMVCVISLCKIRQNTGLFDAF